MVELLPLEFRPIESVHRHDMPLQGVVYGDRYRFSWTFYVISLTGARNCGLFEASVHSAFSLVLSVSPFSSCVTYQ